MGDRAVTATTFTLTGGPALERRLKALGKVPKIMLGHIGDVASREAKLILAAKVKPRKTSNLEHSIHKATVTDRYVEVVATANYAAAVEFGTRPHIIVPRRAGGVLAWGGPRTAGGRLRIKNGVQAKPEHFARRVRHPGTKPKPYLRPGMQKALQIVGVDDIVKAWNGAA